MKLKAKDLIIEMNGAKTPYDPEVIKILKDELCKAMNKDKKFQEDIERVNKQMLDTIFYGRSE